MTRQAQKFAAVDRPMVELRFIVLLVVLALCHFTSQTYGQTPELVHNGDLIDIDVVGGFEFDWRGTITPEGFLDGFDSFDQPVPALCRTEAEIAETVASRLSKILREPKVIVRIVDRSNRAVAIIEGAIRTSYRFQLNRQASLIELIALSGGLTEDASGEIRIFRPRALNCENPQKAGFGQNDNESQFRSIRISDLVSGIETANPQILSGDIITIQRADAIYVIGGVVNPRMISARTQTTLSRAIASSGGLLKTSTGKITIYRRENGETKLIAADVLKIISAETADIDLRAFDIVDVEVKGEPKRKIAPSSLTRGEDRKAILPLKVVE